MGDLNHSDLDGVQALEATRGAIRLPPLPGVRDIAAALEAPGGERAMLQALADTASAALGFSVVINVRRPAWDDFEVAVVTGEARLAKSLLGTCTSWEDWRPVLVERFRRSAAYFVPFGEFDWGEDVARYTPS
ncbi:hypothetical protein PXW74_27280, partial [Klebsiella pneumoniae]|uniref:hypothetical protein n=1 Tax=Klebsiella pneumoniae TaxID=573 RepID=UPI0023817BC2